MRNWIPQLLAIGALLFLTASSSYLQHRRGAFTGGLAMPTDSLLIRLEDSFYKTGTTNPPTVNGDEIDEWLDEEGNYDFAAAANFEPLWASSTETGLDNGVGAAWCDISTDATVSFRPASTTSIEATVTEIIVMRHGPSGTASNNRALRGGWDSTYRQIFRWQTGSVWSIWNGAEFDLSTTANTNWHIFIFVWKASGNEVAYIDGGSDEGGNAGAKSWRGVSLFNNFSSTDTQTQDIYIARYYAYTKALSVAEMNQALDYLSDLTGIGHTDI